MKSILSVGILSILVLFAAQSGANEVVSKVILVTGFEAFGTETSNGSWEALKGLKGKYFADTMVITARLPVAWKRAGSRLQELIYLYKPTAVISFGQAGAEPVRLESSAHNLRDKIPDNDGITPQTLQIYTDAPTTLETSLPLAEIENHLRSAGIPARISTDAGTYLCNDIFYTLMFRPGTEGAKTILRGFIHLPPLNARVKTSQGRVVSFDKKKLQKTAEIIIRTVIAKTDRADNRKQ